MAARRTKTSPQERSPELLPRDLRMLLDLFEVLQGEPDAPEVERRMAAKGWRGGTTFYYRKLAQLERACGLTLVDRGPGRKVSRNTAAAPAYFARVRESLDNFSGLLQYRPPATVTVGATNAV